MSATQLVDQSSLVVSAMGRWPSFHDARVLSVERLGNSCLVKIHVFEMTQEVDERGYFVLRRHHLILLRLSGVSHDSLPKNYRGDVLSSLRFLKEGGQIRVEFESHMDNDGTVLCNRVFVESVAPYDASGIVGQAQRS